MQAIRKPLTAGGGDPCLGTGYTVRACKAVWDGQAAAFFGGECVAHIFLLLTLFPLRSKRVLELGGMINAQILKSVVGFLKF